MKSIILYRHLIRHARQIDDYNVRSYAVRKVRTTFRKNSNLAGDDLSQALEHGTDQLKMLKRISTMSHLYPGARSVLG